MDKPTKAMKEQLRSTHESFLTAAQMPSGMAMPHAMTSAKK
jgi:mannitol/fructose-specific phosphotransferase system IIA component (Ntr-type)